jgi:hypothetical protein
VTKRKKKKSKKDLGFTKSTWGGIYELYREFHDAEMQKLIATTASQDPKQITTVPLSTSPSESTLAPNTRTAAMQPSTWAIWRAANYPDLALQGSKQDLCDLCAKLRLLLSQPGISEEETAMLTARLTQHQGDSRTQRRGIRVAFENWALGKGYDKQQVEAVADSLEEKLPLHFDEPLPAADKKLSVLPSVDLMAEDFAGGIAMPILSLERASVDYFTSNLTMQSFVQCDMTTDQNHIAVYDERLMGKDGEALCALRMIYELERKEEKEQAQVSVTLSAMTRLHLLCFEVGGLSL